MLSPKRMKFRRYHRIQTKNTISCPKNLAFGQFGIQATTASWVSSRQIESGRRAITRFVKRGGKLWIRIYPDKPVTFRPPETRMGSGKGSPEFWIAVVKSGYIIYEILGVPESIARGAMRIASHKLPIKTKFLKKIT